MTIGPGVKRNATARKAPQIRESPLAVGDLRPA